MENNKNKFLDIIEGIIVVLDKRGVVKLMNKKGVKILGCKMENIIGENWFDLFVPSRQRKQVRTAFNEPMPGKINNTEYLKIQF